MCWENSLRSPASWNAMKMTSPNPKFGPPSTRIPSTREPQRDAHLKSADFFHVEKHPALTFDSTVTSRNADGELKVSGDLTIRGVTRKVVFDVEGPSPAQKDPWGNTRIGLSATTRISRKDFGLTWNAALEAGGLLVGDAVTINLDVQLIKER